MRSSLRAGLWRVIILVLLLTMVSSRAWAAGERLLSASNQDHLWFVIESGRNHTTYALCHHAADMDGPFYRPQATLTQMPVALASWDRRVWLVFPPKREGIDLKRDVFTIEVQRNPLGIYEHEPADHLDILSPLLGSGQLLSFIGTADGPVALMLPASVQAGQIGHPKLLKLHNDQWLEIDSPADLQISQDGVLASEGSRGQILSLFAASEQKPGQCTRHKRDESGRWIMAELPFDVGRLTSLTNIGNQLAATLLSKDDERIEVGYVRPNDFASLASLASPSGSWEILGMNGALKIVEQSRDGNLTIRDIHPRDGQISTTQPFVLQRLETARLWGFSILFSVLVSGLLLVFLVKPTAGATVIVPSGSEPMPPAMRLTALLIDMIPGALLTLLVFRCSISDLLLAPAVTIDFLESGPYLFMAAITMLHSVMSELIKGTTLGKAIMGGRIASTNGSSPRMGQVLLRNALKCVIMLLPPLAVIAMLNRHWQGLPDVAARTLVVHDTQVQPETESPDK